MNCMRKLRLNFLILASLIIGLIIFSPIFNFQNQTVSAEDNIIEINFFYSRTCPHCAHEKVFLEKLEDELGIKHGQTTEDKKFSLEMVRCIGCCALSPVIRVDERVYSRVRYNTVMDVVSKHG